MVTVRFDEPKTISAAKEAAGYGSLSHYDELTGYLRRESAGLTH